jgi:TRAP-type mannitol/chloroaromatic compound transport system substrate-binding protein
MSQAAVFLGMNASWWSSLSSWEQALITAASMEEHAAQYEECQANNGEYLAKMIDEHGVVLKEFSDDTFDSFGEAAAEVFENVRDHSALAKKINDNFQTNLRELGAWQSIAEVAFSTQRNRVLEIGN